MLGFLFYQMKIEFRNSDSPVPQKRLQKFSPLSKKKKSDTRPRNQILGLKKNKRRIHKTFTPPFYPQHRKKRQETKLASFSQTFTKLLVDVDIFHSLLLQLLHPKQR